MDNKKIGDYISMLRKKKQLTQKELADRLGVTDKAVSKWERGAGYPDISILKPLSDILGVTVNELLEGEDREVTQREPQGVPAQAETENPDASVSRVLEYADNVMKNREHSFGKIAASILAIALILAVFICVIVNLAVEQRLSWCYIVIAGCGFGGCLLIPPMLYKGKGFLVSLRFLTVLILPFLAVIQYVSGMYTSGSEWLWSIGFPASVTWLFIIWVMVVLYKYKKVKLWLTLAIGALISIPGEAITNTVASGYDNLFDVQEVFNDSVIPSAIILLCVAGIFIVIGMLRQKAAEGKR